MTSTPPVGRAYFCAVAVQSHNSTEVFIYGGWDGNVAGSLYSDVWVLTIPGFRWFPGPAGTSRYGHRCALAGSRQMISVGGLGSARDWYTADEWQQGIGDLDLTAMTWSSSYNATALSYQSPQIVQAWYAAGYVCTHSIDPSLSFSPPLQSSRY
jgi:hypothetical protein